MGRAFVFMAIVGLMPEQCTKLLGKGPSQTSTTSAEPDVPPPPPPTTATTPPTFQLPDPGGPLPTSAPPPPVNPDLAKARDAQKAQDYKQVRAILKDKVKAGKASPEEDALLLDACGNLKDRACIAMVKKAMPSPDKGP